MWARDRRAPGRQPEQRRPALPAIDGRTRWVEIGMVDQQSVHLRAGRLPLGRDGERRRPCVVEPDVVRSKPMGIAELVGSQPDRRIGAAQRGHHARGDGHVGLEGRDRLERQRGGPLGRVDGRGRRRDRLGRRSRCGQRGRGPTPGLDGGRRGARRRGCGRWEDHGLEGFGPGPVLSSRAGRLRSVSRGPGGAGRAEQPTGRAPNDEVILPLADREVPCDPVQGGLAGDHVIGFEPPSHEAAELVGGVARALQPGRRSAAHVAGGVHRSPPPRGAPAVERGRSAGDLPEPSVMKARGAARVEHLVVRTPSRTFSYSRGAVAIIDTFPGGGEGRPGQATR